MTNIFNALENCLQQLENGAEIETILKQHPELANELRPILKTAFKAQKSQTTEPSAEAFQRGRAKVMQHATQLQKPQVIKRKSMMPLLSRTAISFALAFVFLISGTGLLSASASALPGEQLYPVKKGWENIRLFLIFDQEARTLLENEFKNERLQEVNELLGEGVDAEILFVGIFMQIHGTNYVSGIQIILSTDMQTPVNGAVVSIIGFTNSQGWVEVSALELLPVGSSVPVGSPIEVINQNEEAESTTPSENEAITYYDLQGTLQAISTNELIINGLTVYLNNPQLTSHLCIGKAIQAKGYYEADGHFIITEIIDAETCDFNDNSNTNSNDNESNSNDNDNSDGGDSNNNEDDDDDDNDDN